MSSANVGVPKRSSSKMGGPSRLGNLSK